MGDADRDPEEPEIDLAVLDANPEKAVECYEQLRRDLVPLLRYIGCPNPEDIVDEVLYRGLRRLRAVDTTGSGPRAFIFGVARNVAREVFRKNQRERQIEPEGLARRPSSRRDHEEVDAQRLFGQCLRLLDAGDREVLLRYIADTDHGAHAEELGVTSNHLRLIVFRIRAKLRKMAGLPARRRLHGMHAGKTPR